MLIRFTKMHGLGNDFVMVDLITQRFKFNETLIRRLANRNTGIGFDQLLVVETPSDPDMDFRYRIYNADGSEVEHCGNGARCFARFVRDKKLTGKHRIAVETAKGKAILHVREDNMVKVDMGVPVVAPEQIPFTAQSQEASYPIEVDGQTLQISVVSMGNPHGVLQVEDVDSAPVELLGPLLERHERFPARANIGFMQVVNRNEIRLRVFERGAGETQACGTGACAAVVAGRRLGLLDADVDVHLPGGSLQISWQGGDEPLFMTGPTATVFEGSIFV